MKYSMKKRLFPLLICAMAVISSFQSRAEDIDIFVGSSAGANTNPKVIALAPARVEMQCDTRIERQLDRTRRRTLSRCRAIAANYRYRRCSGDPARNPLVERVDRAADRLPAEQQHRRAVEHVNVSDRQGIEHHRVIGRDVRGIDRAFFGSRFHLIFRYHLIFVMRTAAKGQISWRCAFWIARLPFSRRWLP